MSLYIFFKKYIHENNSKERKGQRVKRSGETTQILFGNIFNGNFERENIWHEKSVEINWTWNRKYEYDVQLIDTLRTNESVRRNYTCQTLRFEAILRQYIVKSILDKIVIQVHMQSNSEARSTWTCSFSSHFTIISLIFLRIISNIFRMCSTAHKILYTKWLYVWVSLIIISSICFLHTDSNEWGYLHRIATPTRITVIYTLNKYKTESS